MIPMYMFSPKELAPNEDQGVTFTAIDAPANATLEQVSTYTQQVFDDFKSTPEFDSSFQITSSSGGFGGILMKPWDERTRTVFAIQEELAGRMSKITGIRAPAFCRARFERRIFGRVRDREHCAARRASQVRAANRE